MRSWRPLAVDVAITLAAFAASVALLGAVDDGSARGLDTLGVVLAAASTWPLLARRGAPLAVLAATTVASSVMHALDYPLGPPVGPTLALFFVAAERRTPARIRSVAAAVVALLALHAATAMIPDRTFAPLLFGIVVWGGAWIVGDQVRQRRERVAQLEERARRAEEEAERERRLAVAEERTRIARDLHDSAGHAINVVLVQAAAARLQQERDPAAARAALETIEDVARETIGEIDRLVRVLRDDAPPGAVEPPVGLVALETLAERHRAAGVAVSIRQRGRRRQLAPTVDQAAYRILQEALTNAVRHGRSGAEVVVAYGERALELEVANAVADGAAGRNGGGVGLAGMRERTALLGGSLETGASDGVFRVRARLPYAGGG